jgi:hypothetical protein
VTTMKQGFLFSDDDDMQAAPLFNSRADDDEHDWGEFDSCLTEFGTNHCRLEGQPARIIGTPRTATYAIIEPVDLDAEPIRCCWHVVDMVMKESGAFCRDDDDTDE